MHIFGCVTNGFQFEFFKTFFKATHLTLTRPQCLFLPVYIDTKKRYKMDFLTIKQYLISISPLTITRSCLNFISLKR